jgi:hypothetical protein
MAAAAQRTGGGEGMQLGCRECGISKKEPVGNIWSMSSAEPSVPGREIKDSCVLSPLPKGRNWVHRN